MPSDIFKTRERAFEAVYFAKLDAELIEQLHQKRETAETKSELAKATGIADEALLDRILGLGVTTENLEALSLAPLICVGWANGHLDKEEYAAVLKAIEDEGIDKDSPSYPLLASWLSREPDATLMETWQGYIGSLLDHLDSLPDHLDTVARERIRRDLLKRSEKIARASGGVMGMGSISDHEREVLNAIEAALS